MSPVPPPDRDVVATYREFAPCPELRGRVRAYFSFTRGAAGCRPAVREVPFTGEDSFCSPQFADGQGSLVVDLGATCALGVGWRSGAPVQARAIGALRRVGSPAGTSRPEMIGVYFEPGSTAALLHVPALELTDQVVDLEPLWGPAGARLAEDLAELDEAARLERLEGTLLERVRRAPRARTRTRVDVVGLARRVRAEPASTSVRRLAQAAGVSRQHLTRVFREVIGVGPKRYGRLARFQTGLVHAGAGAGVEWARVAAELGYADQSHMIAEFAELGGLTPEALSSRRWFHPFILEARSRHPTRGQRDDSAARAAS